MQRMLSGIKPTGVPTLGTYLGAIKPFIKYQDDYDLFIFIADLHALTTCQDAKELQDNTNLLAKIYLAAGLTNSQNKAILFRQSDILQHGQLEWILSNYTLMSELEMMTQYKQKCQQLIARQGVNVSLFTYPILMAADILLYEADLVPVGADQKQHIELTHEIARKFNTIYGDTFKLPMPYVTRIGAKIMSLSDPVKKMSKSESNKGTIYLTDSKETIFNKIKKATTDGEGKIYYNPETKPGISNLLTIYAAIMNISIQEVEALFKNETNYGKFKEEVAIVVAQELETLQANLNQISDKQVFLSLEEGRQAASKIASNTLFKVYKKVGLR